MRIGATRAGLDPDTVRVITDPRTATNDPKLMEPVQTGGSLADVPHGCGSTRGPATGRTDSSSRPADSPGTAPSTES